MNELLVGHARVFTSDQDLTVQQNALEKSAGKPALIYTDHGLSGTNRARQGLRKARDREDVVIDRADDEAITDANSEAAITSVLILNLEL